MSFPSNTFQRFSGYNDFLDALETELQKSRPQPIHQDIKDLFSYVSIHSTAALSFNNHPVPRMVINYMQKHEDGSWYTGPTRNVLFPNLDTSLSPSRVSLDGLSHDQIRQGGVGLTMKTFHYNFPRFQANCNTEKFNNEISAVNRYFNDNAALLFAEYYRHTSPATRYPGAVDQYLWLLRSRAYRQLKAAQLSSNTWQHPDLEIFSHFVKLKACGASDATIASVYNTLTTEHPVIRPSAISQLSAYSWKSFRGWLYSGQFDYLDMNAQNVGTTFQRTVPSGTYQQPMMMTYFLCERYMRDWGYWKEADSSCFPGDTLVLLADGHTRRALRDMSIGDEVQTMGFCGPPIPTKAKVTFVSKVPHTRNLYELEECKGIRFTSTHPLVLRGDSEVPVIGFVDPDLASSLNPTWQSLVTKRLASVKEYPSPSTTGEILYDLIVESNEHPDHPSTYILISPSGKQLEVASEAPVMAFFPYAACFFSCIMEEIKEAPATSIKTLLARYGESINLANILDASTKSAWSIFTDQRSTCDIDPHTINMHSLFATLAEPQQLSAAIVLEKLIALLGRAINDNIDTAWLNTSVSPTATPHLILHTLFYLTAPSTPLFPDHDALRIVVKHDDIVLADEIVSTEREGWTTFELQHAVPLTNMPPCDAKQPLVLDVTVRDAAGQQLFSGSGALREGQVTGLAMGGLGCAHDAVFKVQRRMADVAVVERWQGKGEWGSKARCAFAGVLGSVFARNLLDDGVCKANRWSVDIDLNGEQMTKDMVE